MGNKKNPRCNSEGYADPTAYEALKPIIKEETALENKMSFLVKMFKFIAAESGFEIINRIELKDKKTPTDTVLSGFCFILRPGRR